MAKLSLSPPTIPRSVPPTAAETAAAVDDAREEAASAALAAAAVELVGHVRAGLAAQAA